ncbi:NfeD family protein [Anaeromyxobacter paludicola]|uniref:Serine protease n=1 Tax=Anaeromyxobacter paludicola TaxID=2918171 RepID=A0ABM7X606_9BACT|nr:nodulation protein NfeD [Anaeromyxobacter paludicola]BDG07252.1 serine protease [Anaeromyxobacter paludicola]
MRRARVATFALLAAAGAALAASPPAAAPAPESARPRVVTLALSEPITAGSAEYLEAGLARAKQEGAALVAVTLDTPGGALEATREMVQAMLASEVPVAVWVGPAGARAGSAGVFLTLAAQVAAMHPASNIGAAHPVTGGGGDVEKEAGKDMAKKVENDTAAFARSIALARGRNAEWAEKAVRQSVSITAEEALRLKVVDAVLPDLPAVVAFADGRRVEVAGKPRVLKTRGATLEPLEKTVRQRTLSFLADPNVAAMLMLIGMLGLGLELYHPGSIVPGVIGAFCLFLAFLAARVIPVNAGAVVLLLAGAALLVLEAYTPNHGVAAAVGVACVAVGTLLFIDKGSPDYRFDPAAFSLSPLVVWPTPLAVCGLMLFVAWKVVRSRRERLQAGAPGLVGERGEALSEVGPGGGEVFVHGEYWRAFAAAPLPRGARVRVVAVDGLRLTVVADAGADGLEQVR